MRKTLKEHFWLRRMSIDLNYRYSPKERKYDINWKFGRLEKLIEGRDETILEDI